MRDDEYRGEMGALLEDEYRSEMGALFQREMDALERRTRRERWALAIASLVIVAAAFAALRWLS